MKNTVKEAINDNKGNVISMGVSIGLYGLFLGAIYKMYKKFLNKTNEAYENSLLEKKKTKY